MSKELIERLYEESQNDTESLGWKAADTIEQQQREIEKLKDVLEIVYVNDGGYHAWKEQVWEALNGKQS